MQSDQRELLELLQDLSRRANNAPVSETLHVMIRRGPVANQLWDKLGLGDGTFYHLKFTGPPESVEAAGAAELEELQLIDSGRERVLIYYQEITESVAFEEFLLTEFSGRGRVSIFDPVGRAYGHPMDLCEPHDAGHVGIWQTFERQLLDTRSEGEEPIVQELGVRESWQPDGSADLRRLLVAATDSWLAHARSRVEPKPRRSDDSPVTEKRKKRPRRPNRTEKDKEADNEEIAKLSRENPGAKRDEIAEALDISPAHVSSYPAWKTHKKKKEEARDANRARGRGGGGDPMADRRQRDGDED